MSKKLWIILAFLIMILLGGFFWFKSREQGSAKYEVIQRGVIVSSVYGIGTLTAERSFSIKSGVTSTLHQQFVREGQIVVKGEKLVELEGIGRLSAPFSGTVVSAPFKEGETIFAQASVLTLVDPTQTYLLVSIEQQGALRLKPQLPVKISFDGLRDQTFNGRVETIFSNGADFLAHISLADLPKSILPGMTADVAIILEEKKDVLLIPVASLESKNVVLLRKGKIIKVSVRLGLVDAEFAEIISGDVQIGDKAVLIKRETK